MRIVEINSVNKGSTGNIMLGVARVARNYGHYVLVCYPKSRDNMLKHKKGDYLIGNRFSRNVGRFLSQHFKSEHCIHICSTLMLICKLMRFQPDVIHVHNIHDSFLNFPLFFRYIKSAGIPVVWTLHDCWLYTGHCPYYVGTGCNMWQSECKGCKYYDQYPHSSYDDSSYKFKMKQHILLGLGQKLMLAPVSKWLAAELKKSFLKNVKCQVMPNGIDMKVFKPTSEVGVRDKYGIPDGRIILAAATEWSDRKGLKDYYTLAKMLSKNEYIVLVGIGDDLMDNLPTGIVGIKRTDSKEDMAKLYSVANVVLSLSYAETFGLTIIESIACGTPVVAYNNTAQPELINSGNGMIVETGNVDAVYAAIQNVFARKKETWIPLCHQSILKYDEQKSYMEYLNLFKQIIHEQ